MSRVLVLLSGGVDSSTLLGYARENFDEVRALSFKYGQTHSIELEAARRLAEHYQVPHRELTLPEGIFAESALLGSAPIPTVPYTQESLAITVVPGRNLIFLALANAIAIAEGCDHLGIAVHTGDHPVYPDCRPEFIEAAGRAIHLAHDGKVTLWAPFVHMHKYQIVTLGASLGVPYELTYSCYQGKPVHCGVCSTCRERRLAFEKAGVEDPTEYEEVAYVR